MANKTMTEHVESVLPVVADSWTLLRKSDVYRLLSQFGADELDEVAEIVLAMRPDCKKQVTEAVDDISNNS